MSKQLEKWLRNGWERSWTIGRSMNLTASDAQPLIQVRGWQAHPRLVWMFWALFLSNRFMLYTIGSRMAISFQRQNQCSEPLKNDWDWSRTLICWISGKYLRISVISFYPILMFYTPLGADKWVLFESENGSAKWKEMAESAHEHWFCILEAGITCALMNSFPIQILFIIHHSNRKIKRFKNPKTCLENV